MRYTILAHLGHTGTVSAGHTRFGRASHLRAGKERASASHLRIGKECARRIARLGESRALRRVTRGKSWQLIRILSVIM